MRQRCILFCRLFCPLIIMDCTRSISDLTRLRMIRNGTIKNAAKATMPDVMLHPMLRSHTRFVAKYTPAPTQLARIITNMLLLYHFQPISATPFLRNIHYLQIPSLSPPLSKASAPFSAHFTRLNKPKTAHLTEKT